MKHCPTRDLGGGDTVGLGMGAGTSHCTTGAFCQEGKRREGLARGEGEGGGGG